MAGIRCQRPVLIDHQRNGKHFHRQSCGSGVQPGRNSGTHARKPITLQRTDGPFNPDISDRSCNGEMHESLMSLIRLPIPAIPGLLDMVTLPNYLSSSVTATKWHNCKVGIWIASQRADKCGRQALSFAHPLVNAHRCSESHRPGEQEHRFHRQRLEVGRPKYLTRAQKIFSHFPKRETSRRSFSRLLPTKRLAAAAKLVSNPAMASTHWSEQWPRHLMPIWDNKKVPQCLSLKSDEVGRIRRHRVLLRQPWTPSHHCGRLLVVGVSWSVQSQPGCWRQTRRWAGSDLQVGRTHRFVLGRHVGNRLPPGESSARQFVFVGHSQIRWAPTPSNAKISDDDDGDDEHADPPSLPLGLITANSAFSVW